MDNSLIEFKESTLPVPIFEGERWIPIRHVCELIDVKSKDQDAMIKKHPIYSLASRLVGTRDRRGHHVPMSCLPLSLAISWVIGIKDDKRRPGSVEKQIAVANLLIEKMKSAYQLVEIAIQATEYQMQLVLQKEKLLKELRDAKSNVKSINEKIKKVEDSLNQALVERANGQISLPFDELKKLDSHSQNDESYE